MTKKNPHATQDWHRADIIAAVHKRGWSLRSLSRHHGYRTPTALNNALDRKWPKGQAIIAAAIGITPEEIWPSRYKRDFSDSFVRVRK